ncbi:hypothetical protein Tcan_03491 [Toxocara canis]|uniref:Uncharacterized protein n=1 Tax=Toxocara canis TaxID=6265 RepID=A0A0B2VJJ9_TOXCA|nr:hypothetical protein Tcan_03491 [Toxocara canis]
MQQGMMIVSLSPEDKRQTATSAGGYFLEMSEEISRMQPRSVIYSYGGHGNVVLPFGTAFVVGLIFSVIVVFLHIPITNAVLKFIVEKEKREAMKKAESKKDKKSKSSDKERKDSKEKTESKDESEGTQSKGKKRKSGSSKK